jgi:(R,R)-butanediol dehydrogenase/meso-butanediol dehydrogenase/diacetyl reductase
MTTTPAAGRTVPAAVYRRRGQVEVEDRLLPEPGDEEVVVEVAYCGVCGSDLHLIVEGWGTPGDVMGHEWTGTVVEAGPASGFEPGQQVLAAAGPTCGRCEACLAGRPSQCSDQEPMSGKFDGAFATHVVRAADRLLAVPEGMSLRDAALAEPLAVALHGLTRAEVPPGATVLVSGAGPIGALAAAVLVDRGHPVTVSEPAPARQALAERLGARVVHPAELPVFDMAQVDTPADPAYHVVIETSGKRVAMETGLMQLRRGGRMVMLGTGMEQPRLDPNRMIVMELALAGSFVYDADGFEQALELIGSGRLPLDVLIDDAEYGLDGVADAAARLASGEHAGKVMIVPNRR